ncbi:uncharacterized protein METZ01_LOCUS434904, partial [marine metagenome]
VVLLSASVLPLASPLPSRSTTSFLVLASALRLELRCGQLPSSSASRQHLGLVGEQVEDVTEHTGVSLEQLGVATACADHRAELTALDVKNFRPEATGNANLTGFVLVLVT